MVAPRERDATRVAQTMMAAHASVPLVADGRWGSYTQKAYDSVTGSAKTAVDAILESFGTSASLLRASFAAEKAQDPTSKDAAVKARTKLAATNPAQAAFNNAVVPTIRAVAPKLGFANPDLPIAQLALESGHGKKVTGTFNYGGIKASASEPGQMVMTTEYVKGKPVKGEERFKDYSSPEEFARDYLNALVRKWPGTLRARTTKEFAAALVEDPRRRYFTAPVSEYAANLAGISKRYEVAA